MSKKMYDLEQQIMECWNVCEDIKTIYTQVGDGKREPTPDELMNALIGVEQLYNWKFEQLLHTHELALKEQVITNE